MVIARGSLWLVALIGLSACANVKITESTPQAVTVHYYGVVPSLDDATTAAQKACSTYGKTAHLRRVEEETTMYRYAHFDCVGG